jgi:beta-phosphoglucomutase-like phosphatase (HAD superfamily)
MVEKKKPAPDSYLLALAELGLSAKQCLALEDSWNGLQSAMAAEIPTVITPSIYTDDEDFSGATLITPTLAALKTPVRHSILHALIACHANAQG